MPEETLSLIEAVDRAEMIQQIIDARITYNQQLLQFVSGLSEAAFLRFYHQDLCHLPEDVLALLNGPPEALRQYGIGYSMNFTAREFMGGITHDIERYQCIQQLTEALLADPVQNLPCFELVREVTRGYGVVEEYGIRKQVDHFSALIDRLHATTASHARRGKKRTAALAEIMKHMRDIFEKDFFAEINELAACTSESQFYLEQKFDLVYDEARQVMKYQLPRDVEASNGSFTDVNHFLTHKPVQLEQELAKVNRFCSPEQRAALSTWLAKAKDGVACLMAGHGKDFPDIQAIVCDVMRNIYHVELELKSLNALARAQLREQIACVVAEATDRNALEDWQDEAFAFIHQSQRQQMQAIVREQKLQLARQAFEDNEWSARAVLVDDCLDRLSNALTPAYHRLRRELSCAQRQLQRAETELRKLARNQQRVANAFTEDDAAKAEKVSEEGHVLHKSISVTLDPARLANLSRGNKTTLNALAGLDTDSRAADEVSYEDVEHLFRALGATIIAKNGSHRTFRFQGLDVNTLAFVRKQTLSIVDPHGPAAVANDGALSRLSLQLAHVGLKRLGVFERCSQQKPNESRGDTGSAPHLSGAASAVRFA